MKDSFEFIHIDKKLSESDIETVKRFLQALPQEILVF